MLPEPVTEIALMLAWTARSRTSTENSEFLTLASLLTIRLLTPTVPPLSKTQMMPKSLGTGSSHKFS